VRGPWDIRLRREAEVRYNAVHMQVPDTLALALGRQRVGLMSLVANGRASRAHQSAEVGTVLSGNERARLPY